MLIYKDIPLLSDTIKKKKQSKNGEIKMILFTNYYGVINALKMY